MNKNNLALMDERELEAYAKVLGISTKAGADADAKRGIIERRRSRCAKLTVLGVDLEIPVKRAHDKRVAELLAGDGDEELERGMRLLLGDDQYDELAAACVEDDGTVDVDAMAYAVIAITHSRELKNF